MPRSKPARNAPVPAKPRAGVAALGRLLGEPAVTPALAARLYDLLVNFRPAQKRAVALWHDESIPACHLAVVATDQPFLTDTVALCAHRWKLDMAELRHPVIAVTRDKNGEFVKLGGTQKEALIYLRLPPLSLDQAEQVQASVKAAITAAQGVVADFGAMRSKVEDERSRMAATRQGTREELNFVDWLLADHFILMGMRQYRYRGNGKEQFIQVVPGSGMGILRHAPSRAEQPRPVAKLSASLASYLNQPGSVVISKAFTRAPIHRDAAMDYLALRTLDADGHVVSEWRLLGLFTSKAFTTHVGDVPLLSAKLAEVRSRLNYPAQGYSARVLQNVLETWPRDELFLSTADELVKLAAPAVAMREQADTAVLIRNAPREEAISVQVLVPLPRYETRLRQQVAGLLEKMTGGSVTDQRLEMGIGEVARLFFRLYMPVAKPLNEKLLIEAVRQLVRGWADDVQHLLYQQLPLVVAVKLWKNIGATLPATYRAARTPAQSAADLLVLHNLPADGLVRLENCNNRLFLTIYRHNNGWPLHQILPVLADFGLKTAQEQHYTVPLAGSVASIQVIEIEGDYTLAPEPLKRVEDLVGQTLRGEAESDSLNSLLILQDVSIEAVGWLRAWVAAVQQADRRFVGSVACGFLVKNPIIANGLVELFEARFKADGGKLARKINTALSAQLAALPLADDERIGLTFQQFINAILRTNAWQPGAPALAFKLDGQALKNWPKPLVFKEIFVYHPLVEGVHLRGAAVARGGLRNSDRPYDYRIEVLGLQQAQQRKNTIIVPVGAKGGFVVRESGLWQSVGRRMADAQGMQNGALTMRDRSLLAYKIYINALLSVTDTYDAKGRVVHPRGVVCLDGDDPYLVVAADKGTATYSDTANALSAAADYWDGVSGGFWLGDAFASGGSNGYDHKELAITARGAWISVQHHLKALDIVPSAKRPLVMAGIGDPSGDVFGNGVVREPHAQLVAAFNHKHIFLDPDPDPAKSFAERERLLHAVAGWDAYNTKLISTGGGVFARSAKTITLHARVQSRLGLKKAVLTPDEVIKAILKAPVDVIWNGGIGTYIRASDERDEDVGDKANDAVRVGAKDVRARVIGEGGNLGISPRGRVELNLRGVRLNSDALDNSAGVDTSDHEVNLKILLGAPSAARNKLLKQVTNDIADDVLADNVRQNLAISTCAAAPAPEHRDLFALQQSLLKRGVLSEEIDNLPSLPHLLHRDGGKYTRPEIASLMAGTKTVIREELMKPEMTGLLRGPLGMAALKDYFPAGLPKEILARAPKHPLAHAISATVLANRLVNRFGLLMVPHLCADLNTSPASAITAILLAEDWLLGDGFWQAMDAQEAGLGMPALLAAYDRTRAVVSTVAAWMVRQGLELKQAEVLGASVHEAIAAMPKLFSPHAHNVLETRRKGWLQMGFADKLAVRLSLVSPLIVVPDAVVLAAQLKVKATDTLRLQLALGEALQLPALVQKSRAMSFADGWSRQAVMAMLLEFLHCQRVLTERLVKAKLDVPTWKDKHKEALARYAQTAGSVLHEKNLTVAMLSVVIGRLRELAP
ncbi:MAG TPA: NAD-glutamate dehydrogenase domain-containing protein [Alphaproteobacteria bacterium]|nr:NAD-glutamate dehydrogenase domain-containing protein [Alphaproteobacteria bacterium]